MIVVVKGKNYKRLAIKAGSVLALVAMFYFYYMHMSNKFSQEKQTLVQQLKIKEDTKKIKLAKKLEKLIFKESEMVVDLLGQERIQSIRILKNRLFIVCDFDTDIEPLLVRYGVNALVKSTAENIKIAIDLKFIVENKYDG